MIVRIRDQKQKADGHDHKSRSPTTASTPFLYSLATLHQTPLSCERRQSETSLLRRS